MDLSKDLHRALHGVYVAEFYLASEKRAIRAEAARDIRNGRLAAAQLKEQGATLKGRYIEHRLSCPQNSDDRGTRQKARLSDRCTCPDWCAEVRHA